MASKALSDLKGVYEGRPGAVLCGGPSLPSQLEALPPNTVLYGINEHASKFVDCDYIVVCDTHNTLTGEAWDYLLDGAEGVRLSPIPAQSDIDFDEHFWRAGFSGGVGTWAALFMGCNPVILCGADCYTLDKDYAEGKAGDQPIRDKGYTGGISDESLASWRRAWSLALEHCPNAQRIRATEYPLDSIFPLWEGIKAEAVV